MPELGYTWQGYNNIEVGIKPSYALGRNHENISLLLGGNIFKHHVTYISPFINIKYYRWLKITRSALNISCNYSLTKVNGITDQRITPEIGLALHIIGISYGYNIPIGSEKIPFISPHRLSIRWMAF